MMNEARTDRIIRGSSFRYSRHRRARVALDTALRRTIAAQLASSHDALLRANPLPHRRRENYRLRPHGSSSEDQVARRPQFRAASGP
eukprot:784324-Prymnesium_polylepis.1